MINEEQQCCLSVVANGGYYRSTRSVTCPVTSNTAETSRNNQFSSHPSHPSIWIKHPLHYYCYTLQPLHGTQIRSLSSTLSNDIIWRHYCPGGPCHGLGCSECGYKGGRRWVSFSQLQGASCRYIILGSSSVTLRHPGVVWRIELETNLREV